MSLNRIDDIFAALRGKGKTALMPFVTAGYPDIETTAALLPVLEGAGASICEIGIPYSDPIADGPVIAASMHDALERGFDIEKLFSIIGKVRSTTSMGLIAMVSYSIVYRYGLDDFVGRCAAVGFDGFIFPDLPVEESGDGGGAGGARGARGARQVAADAGMSCSLLISPNTPVDRALEIAHASTGFVYLLARVGITGERSDVPEIGGLVARLRGGAGGNGEGMDTPIACGFGIASAEAVRAVTRYADAAIVGSAIVKRVAGMVEEGVGRDVMVERIGGFVGELAGGLVGG